MWREKKKEAAKRETQESRNKKQWALVLRVFGGMLTFCFGVSAKAGDEQWTLI